MMAQPRKTDEKLTVEQALVWLADVLNEPSATVRADTLRTDLPRWDSLGQLVLMSALDDRFGLKLTREELASLRSVRSILDVLDKHGWLVPR
jgi:acyl carrier protein